MRRTAILLCYSFLYLKCLCQTSGFTFTNYSRADGLSDNFIQSIYEDSRGFMWFGTREGLNRYDGTTFRTYYSHQQYGTKLPGNSVSFFFEYKPGHLFFQSDRTPVCMNTITQQFYTPASLTGKQCLKLTQVPGRGYFMSQPGFVYLLDQQLKITDSLTPPLKNSEDVVVAYHLNDTTYLVGSNREFFLYNPLNRKYTTYIPSEAMPAKQQMLMFHYFDPVTYQLYFSNFYEGLFTYDLKGAKVRNWPIGLGNTEVPDGNIGVIQKRSDSTLWITTYSAGMLILNQHTGKFIRIQHNENDPTSLPDNAIASLYTDRSNNTWFGTSNGLCRLNNSNSVIRVWHTSQQKLRTNNGSVLLNLHKGSDHDMYLTTFSSTMVQKIDHRTDQISTLDPTQFTSIWCASDLGKELVFTGGGTSVTFYDPIKAQYRRSDFLKKYFPVSDIVILAFRHSNGDVWYSGNNGGGFVRIDARDGSVHTYKKDGPQGKFKISYYACYAEDKNGDLWFGVNKSEALVHWKLKEDRFEEVNLFTMPGKKELAMTGIGDVHLDRQGMLWVGCDGGGLFRYNIKTKSVTHFSIGNGLPTNYIGSLQADSKNRIWIGTPKGLSCYIPEENKFINFTIDDGLPEDFFNERCTYYDPDRDQLWIGSINALMRFNPDSLLALQRKNFPIYIDEITVNGKKLEGSPEENSVLSPTANTLQFRFTGVDIHNGKEIEYSYRLIGADENWVYNENITTASYANLAPGDYTFSVRARHRGEQEWTEMATPFRFTIQTPWYKMAWFKLLLAALIAMLAWLLIRVYYQRKLEKARLELESKQAIEKERTRIATDMHDDFGASLSRIKFLSEKLQIGHPEQKGTQTDLEKISAYSDEMAEKMGEIVWALNKRYDTTGDLLSFCRSYASEYLAEKPIQLHFSESVNPEYRLNGEIRRNVFLVMKEALHNIVRHSGARQVWIGVSFDDELKMTIKDDGKGFDQEHVRPFSNGLSNMKKRIEDIGGTIQFETNGGTSITIRVNTAIRQNTYKSS